MNRDAAGRAGVRDASRERGAERDSERTSAGSSGRETSQSQAPREASTEASSRTDHSPHTHSRIQPRLRFPRRRRPRSSPDALRQDALRHEALLRRREIARRRLAEGIAPEQIAADFLHWGGDEEHARDAVAYALEQRRRDQLHDCVQPIWVGGSMLLIGILLTLIGVDRSSLADGRIHRYLLLGVGILPAAAAYATFGLIHLLSLERPAEPKPDSIATPAPRAESLPSPIVLPVQSARPEATELAIDLPQRAAA